MKIIAVESSTLRSVAYDKDREVLQLEFQSRAVYRYLGVPEAVYRALLQAPSKGAYFNHHVRLQFPYEQVKAASSH